MNDKALLALLKKDDPVALKYCFDQNHVPLCVLAYRIVKDHDQAKDIVQEVFIRLWRNRASLEITSSLSSYLRKATINSALNFIKSRNEVDKTEARQSRLSTSSSSSTEEDIFYRELTERVTAAIGNLPPRTGQVFVMVRFEEMSYKEVAEALDISVKAVEKEMMKALRSLREALKDR